MAMLFWIFVAGYLTSTVLTWAVNNTTEAKQRRAAPIENAYRAGYYTGLAEGHKLAIAGQPTPAVPDEPVAPPRRGLFRRR